MSRQRSTRKSFVTYRLKNGWTDFQVFGVCGFIWLPWVFVAYMGPPQVPRGASPSSFTKLQNSSDIYWDEFEREIWTA